MSRCKELYEVYVCKYKGETVYIGKGKMGRHKHCKSGVSHVIELNEIYFLGDLEDLEVNVVHVFETNAEALAYERDLIICEQPKFNKVYSVNTRSEKGGFAVKVYEKLRLSDSDELTSYSRKMYNLLISEFISIYNYKDILDGNITLLSETTCRKLGYKSMQSLVNYVKNRGSFSEDHYCNVFSNKLRDNFGYSIKDCKVHTSRVYLNK